MSLGLAAQALFSLLVGVLCLFVAWLGFVIFVEVAAWVWDKIAQERGK